VGTLVVYNKKLMEKEIESRVEVMGDYKICTDCCIEQPKISFSKDKYKKDWYTSKCKSCVKEYYNENAEQIKNKNKEYYDVNKFFIIPKKYKYNKEYRSTERW